MRFSIITVTRNDLPGFKATEQSVRSQDFTDFEWIVMDGASTDGTAEYLPATAAIWDSAPDRGIYDAMNKGLSRARGDYLLFLNGGDQFFAPDTLGIIDTAIKNAANPPDFIYGDAVESLPDGGAAYKRARHHQTIALGMVTHHQSMLYRRDMIGGLRYDTAYTIAADYKFTIESLRRARAPLYIPHPLCRFAHGGVSQQRTALGRREQYAIRRESRIVIPPVNGLITMMQWANMGLRRVCPALYWRMKSQDRDNSAIRR